MKKTTLTFIVIISVLVGLLADVFFGRYLSAKISTLPVLQKWGILNPQAPIVIHTREEVRVSDSEDIVAAVNKTKPKLSSVVVADGGKLTMLGSALNVSSDGVFVVAKASLNAAKPGSAIFVKLNDGTLVQATGIVLDPATNLAFLKAPANDLSVASFAATKSLVAGQRVVVAVDNIVSRQVSFSASFINVPVQALFDRISNSDRPSRSIAIQAVSGLVPGHVVANLDGEVLGVWDGTNMVSADVVRAAVTHYFANKGTVIRPSFGFNYRGISRAESKLLGLPEGVMIVKSGDAAAIVPGSPASTIDLKEKDIITAVNGTPLNEENELEALLENVKPGDEIELSVTRGQDRFPVKIKAGVLK